jgi:hypothetical protein
MDDPQAVVQGSLGDQEVRDRSAVPHAVTVRELALQVQSPVEEVRRAATMSKLL